MKTLQTAKDADATTAKGLLLNAREESPDKTEEPGKATEKAQDKENTSQKE